MATHCSILAWEIPWTEEPDKLQSMGSQTIGHNWATENMNMNSTKGEFLFIYRGLECKSRKSRNTWSNKKIWLWSTKWSRAKAKEICQEDALVISNIFFQQHKRWLYTWTSLDGQHWNKTDYILCSQRWGSSIQSAKTIPGVDCGSDH